MTLFWKDKPSVLLENYFNIIPNSNMGNIEWYNTLTRLLIFIIFLIICTIGINKIILFPCIIILLIYFDKSIIEDDKDKNNTINNVEHFTEITNPIDCQKPTYDNPFMNGLPADNPARKPACIDVENQVTAKTYLDHDLHRDVNDLWEKRNSQRQFYTKPSTQTPDNREEFMKFCWATPYVCRDGDQNHCLEYEDLRVPGYS
jgi:hypothetical protein